MTGSTRTTGTTTGPHPTGPGGSTEAAGSTGTGDAARPGVATGTAPTGPGTAPTGPGTAPLPVDRRVVVAVLTYLRVDEVTALVPELLRQTAAITPAGRVLVVDNDPAGSARDAVEGIDDPRVQYVHETVPGIAAARNRALDEATDDDVLVFIDDDERPVPHWLTSLLTTLADTGAAAVVGPVVSEFAVELSPWVRAGRFFDRRRLPTGTPIDVAATNNMLLDLTTVRRLDVRFDTEFGISGGSDTLFSRELHRGGGRMVWCADALVVDQVPPQRTTARWVLQRALRGGNSWSRVEVTLTPRGPRRALVRGRLAWAGASRLGVGALRAGYGLVTRDLAHQARGVRLVARGAGLLGGAFGWVYQEYKRPRRPSGRHRT